MKITIIEDETCRFNPLACTRRINMLSLFHKMRVIFFAGLLSIVIIFTLGPKSSYAQLASNSALPTKYVNYDLAYPGILPDHPLYKLKVLRDKISPFLITDPKKRVDFFLLQVDKGILASAMLIDKNKIKLAEETILKAEHNFTLITYELWKFQQKPNTEFFSKLKTASLKHQEIINSIIKRVPKENRRTFETVLEFSKRNLQTVEKYQSNKYRYYNRQ